MTANNLAVRYKSEGRYDEAGPLFRRALAILEAALEPEHPHVVTCRENYEELLEDSHPRNTRTTRKKMTNN
jgi:hypothetical protein